MPTLIEFLSDYLSPTEASECLNAIEVQLTKLIHSLRTVFSKIGEVVYAVADSPPSLGYEPFFVQRGVDPILARAIAQIVVHRGRRVERELRLRTEVVKAIKFVAKPGRGKTAVRRRALALLAAREQSAVLEIIFDEASLGNEAEFVEALASATRGEDAAHQRLSEMAATLSLRIPSARGRKITAASAAHEFFLAGLTLYSQPVGFTYSDYGQDYTDKATQATRLEFANPSFGPQPARRRMLRRLKCALPIAGPF